MTSKSSNMIIILLIVGLFCVITIVMIAIITYVPKDAPPAINYQLKDPPGPVETDYLDILSDIEYCTSQACLKNVHTRILIFQSCYPTMPALIAVIWAKYNQKMVKVNSVT